MAKMVVLYPSPGMGHLVSMVELGKLFLHRGFAVTVVTVEASYTTGAANATSDFISRMSSFHPSLSFHRLPAVSLPPNTSPHHEAHAFDLLRLSNPYLLDFLSSSRSSPVAALIVDFFCTLALDVAAELRIPSYVFFTCNASVLAAFLHLPILHTKLTASFKDLGAAHLQFPGLPPIPASDMPLPLLDREDEGYKGFLFHYDRMPEADGIIVNTFASLELRPLQAIADGLVVPGRKMPPVYCVGPVIASGDGSQTERRHESLEWLDSQPLRSVVFLCFGSLGVFSAAQLREVAAGLEKSGQRFLWVVRSPDGGGNSGKMTRAAATEPELEELLPEGFLERTRERGKVVRSWAPQAEVLRHAAVGGFVTHCGWNSVLEAIVGGVPMVVWPLYAEQRMNKVLLVEEMRLAVEMKGFESGMVAAGEVEDRVRGLMEAEWGKEMRARVEAVMAAALAAVADGGPSISALNELAATWKNLKSEP
ncbi:Anthocyanidin 5,3-O-glucosyltransferase [Apostasia shenzhenica]|uniref:Glycosyltransferase n=1 Tax=Apostasia shenzhenica TaxID=1088818 RepID=A0A2I0B3X5_9ASPA|nr:Anthocyanidin 5,3-O-glucosyltransferase [Apostasia shenzhenica]